MSRREHGTALLLALSVLAILSLLASGFVRMTMTERQASAAYADRVRARMLAEAGSARAIGHLSDVVVGAPHDGLGDAWVCDDAPDVPLGRLTHPSLSSGTAHGRVYSGLLGADTGSFDPYDGARSRDGAYALDGDQYVLRITDLGARIDLGRPEASGEGALRLLGGLCRRLDLSDAVAAKLADGGPIGTRDALARAIGEPAWSLLAPYVTVHGWRDRTALALLPRSDPELPALERVLGGRAPLHVNLAPKLLIAASLDGIRARWYDPKTDLVETVSLSAAKADALAELIDARRRARPFSGLADIETFLVGLIGDLLTAEQAALIAVHADPDARLVKLNPDLVRFGKALRRPFDRSDLDRYTVEWSCRGSGVYRIESRGRVIGPAAGIAARTTIDTIVRLGTTRRITAQTDWAKLGKTSSLRSYPEADPAKGHAAIGSLGLGRAEQGGLEWFEPTSFAAIGASSPEAEGTATLGKATAGADRYADGLHADRKTVRYAAYDASSLGKDSGSVELWWKPDHSAPGRTGALFYADQPTSGPGKDGAVTGFSTVLYQRAGMLFASRTRYRMMGGVPGHYAYASTSPVTVVGELRADAAKALEAAGSAWLKSKKPGLKSYYYPAYGILFRHRLLRAIARGSESEVLYIYEFEKVFGYAHIGCVTQYVHVPDYYGLVFKTGYKTLEKQADTTSYLDVVDESGNDYFDDEYYGDEPYAASRVERGVDLGPGLDPHRWYHIRIAWTDGTDLRLFVDGVESRDHERWYGPITPWSSRLVKPDARMYAGPIRLARASGEGGTHTPELTGKTLLLGHHGTLEGLSLRSTGGMRAPGSRYVHKGSWKGSIAVPQGGRFVRASTRTSVPAECRVISKATSDGSTVAFSLTLARSRAHVTPFVHSITLVFAQPPAVLARRER